MPILVMLLHLTQNLAQTKNIGHLVSFLGSISLARPLFGAALLFDETEASFTWLFETFLATHNGKQPRTIYTDQDAAMGKAIKIVFTESYHGLCTFHIMQNAVKLLSPVKDKEEEEGEKEEEEGEEEEDEEESHILSDFSACMYGHEEKASFEEAFQIMRSKVHKQIWLDSIYKV